MQQLTQKLKNGTMRIVEVPFPSLHSGQILVRNHYSLVSAGTEGSTVKAARKSLIGKAKERPQQVKQVIETLKTQGPVQTYRAVMKKLEALSPLGYSCSGEVIDMSPDVKGFSIGDRVACGGLSASHAEVVSVPQNLCVKLSPDADMKAAAFNTLGAIAMQAVRQADLKLGETCAVIGLGLLGQLTAQLLRASGVKVIGVDIDPEMVRLADTHSADFAFVRSTPGIETKIIDITQGMGCDGVIIAAATDSLDPINFAGAVSRKRGTIVILGAVPTGFDREPHFYKKELQVKMSCSYGPGRYDPVYEEKGIDYPPAYVRWTEKRNMMSFQELLYSKKIDTGYLTTHVFPLEDAKKAYDMMMAKTEPFIGILLKYNLSKKLENISKVDISADHKPASPAKSISVGFIGAGSYAQSHLIPNLPKGKVSLTGVVTSTGTSARSVAEKFGFEFSSTNAADILDDERINTIFIASRHDSHASYVLDAIKKGKHCFVEKPLCLEKEQLEKIRESLQSKETPILMVGYNRRFAPLSSKLKQLIGKGPLSATYRVNAGAIPADSWIQDMDTGGGRIMGEVCHFVDFLIFLTGALPVSVYATAMDDHANLNDVVSIALKFSDGSIGTISYFSNGDKGLEKERIEVFSSGMSAVLHDFKRLTIYAKGKKKTKKLLNQNKGQQAEISSFLNAVKTGGAWPITFKEIYATSLTTFKIHESIRSGQALGIST